MTAKDQTEDVPISQDELNELLRVRAEQRQAESQLALAQEKLGRVSERLTAKYGDNGRFEIVEIDAQQQTIKRRPTGNGDAKANGKAGAAKSTAKANGARSSKAPAKSRSKGGRRAARK